MLHILVFYFILYFISAAHNFINTERQTAMKTSIFSEPMILHLLYTYSVLNPSGTWRDHIGIGFFSRAISCIFSISTSDVSLSIQLLRMTLADVHLGLVKSMQTQTCACELMHEKTYTCKHMQRLHCQSEVDFQMEVKNSFISLRQHCCMYRWVRHVGICVTAWGWVTAEREADNNTLDKNQSWAMCSEQ